MINVQSEIDIQGITMDSKVSPNDPLLRRALFEVHKGICFYTKTSIVFWEMAVEHIHPRAKGWLDTFANYFPSCKSVNSLKWAKYDYMATNELLQINRLLYAPRVLEYYKNLIRQMDKRKQINDTDSNVKKLVPKPNVIVYGGGAFIESLVDATLWKIDYLRMVWSRYADVYRFSIGRNESSNDSLVDEHFASPIIQELFQSEVYLNENGALFEWTSNIHIIWWANLMTTSWTHGRNELDISVNLDHYFPEGSYGHNYITWLKIKIEDFLKQFI